MWSSLRALAARIGLSAEQVEAVEREGNATEVQHPLDDQVHIMVRPDPDWPQRMLEAWEGRLVNSRQEVAGTITVDGGVLAISDVDSPEDSVAASIAPGEYQLTLTIACSGSKQTFDDSEGVSHAFLTLQERTNVTAIEPYPDENGAELGVDAYMIAFAIPGVLSPIAGDHAGRWSLRVGEMFQTRPHESDERNRHSIVITDDNGSLAAIVCRAGNGREDYPLFRLIDEDGRTIGIAADFYVDNRPW